MRRWLVIVLAVGAVGLLTVGVTALVGVPTTGGIAPGEDPRPALVELETGQAMWPYYSSVAGEFEQRSAINLVFLNATTSDVVGLLADDADWLETGEDETDAGTEAFSFAEFDLDAEDRPLGWGRAVGAERFMYVETGAEGHWLDEAAQLHDGDYFGTRNHLRLYDLPGEEPAVAIQAHAEHFDWFTLRHTVTSVERAQSAVEGDLMELLGMEHVTRAFHGNTGVYDADGWVTVVAAVLPLVLVIGAARREVERAPALALLGEARERIDAEHLLLGGAMIGLLLGVRLAGIGLERHVDVHVHWIAAGLFPVLGLGLPLAAYGLGRRFGRRMDAAMSASVGLATAVLLDYLLLGVTVLPVEIVLHRGGLVVAVGLLAAGGAAHAAGAATTRRFVAGGAVLWAGLVLLSLVAVL